MGFRGGETATVADEENEPVVETKELTVPDEPVTDSEKTEEEPAAQTPENQTSEDQTAAVKNSDSEDAGAADADADAEQVPEEEQLPEENPEIIEEEIKYGCAVYYYYDGVEDEDARVEAAGAFGDPIFGGAVENEVVHNEKNYVLDHVENKDGRIGEDAAQNVVRVYYVLAEEDAEYEVTIHHILVTDIGTFRTTETVALADKDFTDDSIDLISHAYSREGMVCETTEARLSKTDFSDGLADITIEYTVADGWKAVRKSDAAAPASNGMRRARAIYVGEISDVDIVPLGQIPVSISFVYEDGGIARPAETKMVEETAGEYTLEYLFDGILGYSVTLDDEIESKADYSVEQTSDGKWKLTAVLSEEIESDSVGIKFVAAAGKYVVVTRVPNIGFKEADLGNKESYEETRSAEQTDKKVGALTEVQAEEKTGFTAKTVKQQKVAADGTTEVVVEYVRNNFTITYDTQGGSYIPAKKALYGDTADVYSEEAAKPGTPAIPEKKELICEKEEHRHSLSECYKLTCTNNSWLHSHTIRKGCYTLTCDKEEGHIHSVANGCYKITPAVPAVPATPATWNPTPTKQGYAFGGWYQDAACTTPADKTADNSITVYAKWEKREVNYTVLYYIENANDDKYSYLSNEIKTEYPGEMATVTAATAPPTDLDKTNFTFDYATSVVVAADGSSVVRAYYKRNVYTLTSDISFNGKKLTLTAKYGATITGLMNDAFNVPTNNDYAWSLTDRNDDKVAVFDTMPSGEKANEKGEITVYEHDYSVKKKQTLSYWLENYAGSEMTTFEGKTYGLYKEIEVKFNYLNSADFYDFPGYTKYKAIIDGRERTLGSYNTENGTKADFYYNANECP